MAATPRRLRALPDDYDDQAVIASSVRAMLRITDTQQQELAERAEIDPTALSKSLKTRGRPRKITAPELGRIATALTTPLDVFYLGGDEIDRRARAGVLVGADGPDTPDGQEIATRACNGARVVPFPTYERADAA